MTRIAIVGQAPGANNGRRRPFEGPCARRLADLAGMTEAQLRRRVRMRNLLPKWPGNKGWTRGGKGDAFPIAKAKRHARRNPLGGGRTILAGRNVALAYGIRNPRYFELLKLGWDERGRAIEAVVIPHPSGVNRWWNDPGNVDAARRFLRGALR